MRPRRPRAGRGAASGGRARPGPPPGSRRHRAPKASVPPPILGPRMAATPQSEGRRTRLAEQRRQLPDGPGVYLFRDEKQKVIYVGKAKSIKKRVASHFSNPVTRGAFQMVVAI